MHVYCRFTDLSSSSSCFMVRSSFLSPSSMNRSSLARYSSRSCSISRRAHVDSRSCNTRKTHAIPNKDKNHRRSGSFRAKQTPMPVDLSRSLKGQKNTGFQINHRHDQHQTICCTLVAEAAPPMALIVESRISQHENRSCLMLSSIEGQSYYSTV